MSATVISIAFGYVLAAAAIVILTGKIFYPNHRIIAVILYAISWIPFIIFGYHLLMKHKSIVAASITNYGLFALLGILLLLFAYFAWVLLPATISPLIKMTPEQLKFSLLDDAKALDTITQDMNFIVQEISNLAPVGKESNISPKQEAALRDAWQKFYLTAVELDIMKNKYRGFYQINYLRRPTENLDAFTLAFSSFVAKYQGALLVNKALSSNDSVRSMLNEEDEARNMPANTYDAIKLHLTDPDEIVRLSAGRLHLKAFKDRIKNNPNLLKQMSDHFEDIDKIVIESPRAFARNPIDILERKAFTTWFPVQKKIALHASYIKAKDRPYFITPEILKEYKDRFKPGDILLERREWHATNVGIPGFWPHSALYIGTLEEMDEYFKDIPQLKNLSASEFIKKKYPDAYIKLSTVTDPKDFPLRIIESKRPGVIFLSLEQSANADSLAVLRPKTSKQDKFNAIINSMSFLGRPYDFEFDFATDNALVCSELIYKSYENSAALSLQTKLLNGRTILPPNDIAKKYAEEVGTKDQELELSLFLDGREKKSTVIEGSIDDFVTSWNRPKWHIFVQDS